MPVTTQCPICQASLSASIRQCPVCGARLPRPTPGEAGARAVPPGRAAPAYDSARGEDDLFAPQLIRFPWRLFAVPLLIGMLLLVIVCALAGVALFRQFGGSRASDSNLPTSIGRTAVPTLGQLGASGGGSGPTLTQPPTLFMPTLTPAPPPTNTPAPTNTPGPCEQVVQAGDTLYILAARCGHRHYDTIVDTIVEMNDLRSPESLQIGQTIFIPWPTPTPGAVPPGDSGSGAETGMLPLAGQAVTTVEPGAEATEMLYTPTPTLQPGVAWYTVRAGDTIIGVALQFDANIEILSQLNPEVTFSQCDFGMDSGGANCIVNLFEGQQLRVPAPLPTPTLSPTPSGSETATPTPSPTFNAPSLLSPGNLAHYGASEMVTLRWVTTGTLSPGEVYLITLTDTATNAVRTATSTETLLIVPAEWQPTDGQRHTFSWSVAVGSSNGAGGLASVTYTTESRTFTWDSR